MLSQQEKIPEAERQEFSYYSLDRITGGTAVECHLLYNVAYFGIMTDLRYDKEKAKRFLNDLYSELNVMYKNNIGFIKRQQNLKPNVYNTPFKASFTKVYDRYNTAISMTNVNAAIAMTDEIKQIAQQNIKDYTKNMEDTQKLLVSSQEMNMLAKDYQKNANTLELETKKSNWWLCSKQCLMIFGGAAVVIAVFILIIYFMIIK